MADGIYQLTFVATERPDLPPLPQNERLTRLFAQASRMERSNLTGILLDNGHRVIFCLEGEEMEVAAEYDRIKTSPRMQGIAILRQREVSDRSFRRWGFAIDDDPRFDGASALVDRLVALVADAPPEIRQTFLAFAKL